MSSPSRVSFIEDEAALPEVGVANALLNDEEWIDELADEAQGLATDEERTANIFLEDEVDQEGGDIGAVPSPMNAPSPFRYALESDWVMLFRNLCHAISHKAPWSYKFQISDEEKSAIMKKVITRFTQEFITSAEEKDKIKAILREIRKQEGLEELQSLLVSYTNNQANIWSQYDKYRNLRTDNFIGQEPCQAFKKYCRSEVQSRVRQVQAALSELDQKKKDTKEMWETIHEPDFSCFGGSLTIHVDYIEAEEDPAHLPDKGYVTVEIQQGHEVFGEAHIQDKLKRSEDDIGLLESVTSGKGETGAVGCEPIALFLAGNLDPEVAQLRIRLRKSRGGESWGCFGGGGKDFAVWEIPIMTLYKSVEAFNSPKRKEYMEMGHFPGAHFIHINLPNADRDINGKVLSMSVAVTLDCKNETHCSVPMTIDPKAPDPTESEEIEELEDRQARADEIWSVDHHAAALKLLEIFSNLQDEEYAAFQLYCDRYLVHQELFEVGTLSVTATRSEFCEDEDRRNACVAVQSLMQKRTDLTTRTCSGMADKALDRARELCICRLLKLENVVYEDFPQDAERARAQAVFIIERTGLRNEDLVNVLSDRVKEQASVTEKKLTKLAFFLGAGDGEVNGRRRGGPSMMLELENTDKSLFTKVKVLHKLIKTVYTECNSIIAFAKSSESERVMLLALMRVQVTIDTLVASLKNTLVAVWAQLTLSKEAVNPLGGSLGVLAHLYKETMQFVDKIATDHGDQMADCCTNLGACFDDFLINWITLCNRKILFWVETTIEQTPLEPMDGANYNTSATDVLQMLSEVFQFYYECSQSGDPTIEQVTIPKFCDLLSQFAVHFVDTLTDKGKKAGLDEDSDDEEGPEFDVNGNPRVSRNSKKQQQLQKQGRGKKIIKKIKKLTNWRRKGGDQAATKVKHDQPYSPVNADVFPQQLTEYLATICTVDIFKRKFKTFWENKVHSKLFVASGSSGDLEPLYDVIEVRARTSAVLAETCAKMDSLSQEFDQFVRTRLFDYGAHYMSTSNTAHVDLMSYTAALGEDLDGAVVLIGENTDEGSELQRRLIMMCILSYRDAFEARIVQQAEWPLLPEAKELDLEIISVLEDVMRRNAEYYQLEEGNSRLGSELLMIYRSMQEMLQLSCSTSKQLVESLNDRLKTATLSKEESGPLHKILSRRKDADAEKYWRLNPHLRGQ